MIASPSALEERLLHGYRGQLSLYDEAAEILGKARASQAPDASNGDYWAHALHAILQEAATLDASMAHDVAAWRKSEQTPGESLKEILQLLAQRIQTLSEVIDQQISDMRSRQQGLATEIDGFIQNRRMLQAYVNHG